MPKEYIVPGVHDPCPPQGRVKLTLRNGNNGRLKHQVKIENAVMDWFVNMGSSRYFTGDTNPAGEYVQGAIANTGREASFIYDRSNMDAMAYAPQDLITGGWGGYAPDLYLPGDGMPGTMNPWSWCNAIWTSPSTLTPDSGRSHIPSDPTTPQMTAYSWLFAAATGDSVNFPARGVATFADYIRGANGFTLVHDWGVNQGNGWHSSVGIGSINERHLSSIGGGSQGFAMPGSPFVPVSDTSFAFRQSPNPMLNCTDQPWYSSWYSVNSNLNSICFIGNHQYIAVTTSTFRVNDPVTRTYSGAIAHGGTSSATYFTHDRLGDEVWSGHAKTLRRYSTPTDFTTAIVSMPTADNTYSISGSFTDAAILDITNDGVHLYALGSTKVFKYLLADGSAVANWTHGHSNTLGSSSGFGSIAYDKRNECLFVMFAGGYQRPGYLVWGGLPGSWSVSYDGTGYDDYHISFTTTGTQADFNLGPGYATYDTNDTSGVLRGIQDFTPDGLIGLFGNYRSDLVYNPIPVGPSMLSHALLGSPVEKTSSETMNIEYEFTFT